MSEPARTMIELPTDDTPIPLAAVMYCEAGFAVVPLYGIRDGRCTCDDPTCEPRSAGKHPIGKSWQKHVSHDPDDARERFRGHRGNIGLVMGSGLVTLDVDGPIGFESLAALGELPETLTSRSGSGVGEHRIFRFAAHHDPAEVTNRAIRPKLDIKTRSGQIVVAPSLHRAGNRYTWTVAVAPAELPDRIYEQIRKQKVVALHPPRQAPTQTNLLERATRYMATIPPAVSGSGGHAQTFAAARAIEGWIRKGLSRSDGAYLLEQYNATCQPPWSPQELAHKLSEAARATDIPILEDREQPQRYRPVTPGEPPTVDAGPPAVPPAPSWRSRMVFDASKTGGAKPAKHPENAIVITRYHPDWLGKIRLDTHSNTVTVTDPPWHESDAPTGQGGTRAWTDNDTVRLSAWIRREVPLDLSVDACDRAVLIAADANTYHPVRDWLTGLTWDGAPRLSTLAARVFGAELPAHYDPIRWWMIAAVARTFEPGCKVDNVLILEGAQGLRKSSALSLLASPAWFSDTPLDLSSKDAVIALQGKLVIELAELESLRGAEAARAKSFFSTRIDDYRPPYGRRSVKAPRQCVFAGTVNQATYLKDSTGNRRYWPVACTRVDLDTLAVEREQLWAEAVHWYRAGLHWWPSTPEAVAACVAAQEPRAEGDEWAGLISTYLHGRPADEPSVGEILLSVMNLPREKWTRGDQMRVSSALHQLGYVRTRMRENGSLTYRYKRVA